MVLGVVLGDGIYLLLGSYEWAFAFSGFGCLPMIPLLYWCVSTALTRCLLVRLSPLSPCEAVPL